MRGAAFVLLSTYLTVLLAPAFVVIDFLVERERIIDELCVQRLVPEDVRTCHGQCYLMRTLNKVEKKEKELPGELRALRLDDTVSHPERLVIAPPSLLIRVLAPRTDAALQDGWCSATDPVPWC